ncbi:unnamed protein product [Parnassius apollo]|uniref:(apollo) hypothetical protein n=1 Tax=Parnassius apollo TaxID=110799 RepID=A0A8S3X2J2_PARAO|nr:unnamed protein product [Parnassius apollo]
MDVSSIYSTLRQLQDGWYTGKKAQMLDTPKKDTLDYLEFKAVIANSLLYFTPAREQIHLYEEICPSTPIAAENSHGRSFTND